MSRDVHLSLVGVLQRLGCRGIRSAGRDPKEQHEGDLEQHEPDQRFNGLLEAIRY